MRHARRTLLYLFLFGLLLASHRVVQARDVLDIQVYSTPDRALTVEQVRSLPIDKQFVSHEEPRFNFGLGDSVVWIRFRLPDRGVFCPTSQLVLTLDYAMEDIQLFIPLQDRSYAWLRGGFGLIQDDDEISGLAPSFLLPNDYDASSFAYLRVDTYTSSAFTLELWERQEFHVRTLHRTILLSVLAGLMIAMALYNMLLIVALRRLVYLYYVLYTLAMLVYQSDVVGLVRIIDRPLGNLLFGHSLPVPLAAAFFWVLFTYSFVNVRRNTPRLKPVFWFFLAVPGIALVLVLGGLDYQANILAYLLGLTGPLLGLVTVASSQRRGHRISPFYGLGILVLLAGTFVFALRGVGLLTHSVWVTYSVFMCAAMEAMLYSFALADQIRALRSENYLLRRQGRALTRMSIVDDLTTLYNRRFFHATLSKELAIADQEHHPLSLILLDIDRFKDVNDRYGHQQGDLVLQRLAEVLKETSDDLGFPCRVGGEEFAVILPRIDLPQAVDMAEQLRESFAAQPITLSHSQDIRCTMSLGVVQSDFQESVESLYDRADRLLYKAKYQGRNQVVA